MRAKKKAGNIFSPTTWSLPENPICDGKRKWVSFMIFVIIYKIELDISHPPRILLSWSWIWNWQHSLRSRYWYRKPAKSRWESTTVEFFQVVVIFATKHFWHQNVLLFSRSNEEPFVFCFYSVNGFKKWVAVVLTRWLTPPSLSLLVDIVVDQVSSFLIDGASS